MTDPDKPLNLPEEGGNAPSRGFTIVDRGIAPREVNTRPNNPLDKKGNWGLRGQHLDKHFFGDADTALRQIDPGGTADQWSQNLSRLYGMPETSRTSNGMIDIIGEFPKADGSGMYKMGIRLFERTDGTFDLVTVLTKQ